MASFPSMPSQLLQRPALTSKWVQVQAQGPRARQLVLQLQQPLEPALSQLQELHRRRQPTRAYTARSLRLLSMADARAGGQHPPPGVTRLSLGMCTCVCHPPQQHLLGVRQCQCAGLVHRSRAAPTRGHVPADCPTPAQDVLGTSSPAADFVLHKRDSADNLQGLSSRMQALLLQVLLQSFVE